MTKPDSVIGERYDPFGAHLEDPYSFYRRARVEQPVFYSTVLQAWVITRYEDVRYVLMHPQLFSSRNAIRSVTASLTRECTAELERGYWPPRSLHNTDGTTHKRLHGPFRTMLNLKSLRRLEPFIRAQVNELVDAMLPPGNAEIMRQFAHPLLLRVHARLLGIEESDYQILQDSNASPQLFRGNHSPAEQLAYARQTVRFHRLMLNYAKERRAKPQNDVLSMIVAELAPGSAPLSAERETELVWGLGGMVGPAKSAAAALGTGIYYLLANHDRWDTLVTHPKLIGNAIEEILRYAAPVQTLARVTRRPITIGGVHLPAGAEIMGMLGSANRDDTLVDRPDEFDINRPRMRHLTFGQGSHVCVGAAMVRTEMRITLEIFTRRLPGLRLAGDHEVRITPGLNHRQPLELPVTW
jgi:cytochrome P450